MNEIYNFSKQFQTFTHFEMDDLEAQKNPENPVLSPDETNFKPKTCAEMNIHPRHLVGLNQDPGKPPEKNLLNAIVNLIEGYPDASLDNICEGESQYFTPSRKYFKKSQPNRQGLQDTSSTRNHLITDIHSMSSQLNTHQGEVSDLKAKIDAAKATLGSLSDQKIGWTPTEKLLSLSLSFGLLFGAFVEGGGLDPFKKLILSSNPLKRYAEDLFVTKRLRELSIQQDLCGDLLDSTGQSYDQKFTKGLLKGLGVFILGSAVGIYANRGINYLFGPTPSRNSEEPRSPPAKPGKSDISPASLQEKTVEELNHLKNEMNPKITESQEAKRQHDIQFIEVNQKLSDIYQIVQEENKSLLHKIGLGEILATVLGFGGGVATFKFFYGSWKSHIRVNHLWNQFTRGADAKAEAEIARLENAGILKPCHPTSQQKEAEQLELVFEPKQLEFGFATNPAKNYVVLNPGADLATAVLELYGPRTAGKTHPQSPSARPSAPNIAAPGFTASPALPQFSAPMLFRPVMTPVLAP